MHPFLMKNSMAAGLKLATDANNRNFSTMASYWKYILKNTKTYNGIVYSINGDIIKNIYGLPLRFPMVLVLRISKQPDEKRIVLNSALEKYKSNRSDTFKFLLSRQKEAMDNNWLLDTVSDRLLEIEITLDIIIKEKLKWSNQKIYDIISTLHDTYKPIYGYSKSLEKFYTKRLEAIKDRMK